MDDTTFRLHLNKLHTTYRRKLLNMLDDLHNDVFENEYIDLDDLNQLAKSYNENKDSIAEIK